MAAIEVFQLGELTNIIAREFSMIQSSELRGLAMSCKCMWNMLEPRMACHNENHQYETMRIGVVEGDTPGTARLAYDQLNRAFANEWRCYYVRRVVIESRQPLTNVAPTTDPDDSLDLTWEEVAISVFQSLVSDAYADISPLHPLLRQKIKDAIGDQLLVLEQPSTTHGFLLGCLLLDVFPRAVDLAQELGQEWDQAFGGELSSHFLEIQGLSSQARHAGRKHFDEINPILLGEFPMVSHFVHKKELTITSTDSHELDVEALTWLPYMRYLRRLTLRGRLRQLRADSELWCTGRTLQLETLEVQGADSAVGPALSLLLYGTPALRTLRVEVAPTPKPVHDLVNAAIDNTDYLDTLAITLSADYPAATSHGAFSGSLPGGAIARKPPRIADLRRLRHLTVDMQLLDGNEEATAGAIASSILGDSIADITLVVPNNPEMEQLAEEVASTLAAVNTFHNADVRLRTRSGQEITRQLETVDPTIPVVQ